MFTAEAINSYNVQIAALDPLGADALMTQLPEANAAADVRWLIRIADKLTSRSTGIDVAVDACAALRDLGFVMSSIGRHRPDALESCPWEPELLRLGGLADEVPRDTVYSYTSRNPNDDRRRSFTATGGERLFIVSVAEGIGHLNIAVESVVGFVELEPAVQDNLLLQSLTELDAHLRRFAECLLRVKRAVTPEFFTGQLRPYYPPIRLGDQVYFGPGGAQMPQLVLDVVLLRPDRQAPLVAWHDAYVTDNARYLPRPHRDLIGSANTRSAGLISRFAGQHTPADTDNQLLAAMRTVVASILRFRYPHQQMARANMNVRPPGSVGSGGYCLEAVNQLVGLTSHAIDLLDRQVIA